MVSEQPISELSVDESWRLLSSVTMGRLVATIGTRLEIFPVNFVVQRRTILFRTAEGTKLAASLMNDRVLFEADDNDLINGWSVIVRGVPELLETPDEIAAAEDAQLLSWTTTQKRRFVRIKPLEVSGRYFQFGGEPGHPVGATPKSAPESTE